MTYIDNPNSVKLKKSLGQHFLIDESVLSDIKSVVHNMYDNNVIIEVGPGMGALTEYLVEENYKKYYVIEKDDEFVKVLSEKYAGQIDEAIHQDVLEYELKEIEGNDLFVVGNYPYNISTQIMFWILENRNQVSHSVGMFQKEVARRIASQHGSKEYGTLSVLTQAFYEVKYEFDIAPEAFDPPPRVWSGVISMKRLSAEKADFHKLKRIVKMAFNQRRKMLRNSLKSMEWNDDRLFEAVKTLRPEQVSVDKFCELSKMIK